MAKRHHQSERSRSHESRGMEHYEKSMEMHGTSHSRRHEEMRHAGMINEDHMAVANLPQEVHYYPYPKPYDRDMSEALDDTMTGIDNRMRYDDDEMHRHMNPKKF